MKKLLIVLLALCLSTSLAFAQFVPTGLSTNSTADYEDNSRVHFTSESKGTSSSLMIGTIVWASASGDEVGGTGGFILQDRLGNFIAGVEATTVSDNIVIPMTIPIYVDGLWVPHLDGDLTIYGKRR